MRKERFSLAGEGVEAVSSGRLSLRAREGGAGGLKLAEATGGVSRVRGGDGLLGLAHVLGLGVGLNKVSVVKKLAWARTTGSSI